MNSFERVYTDILGRVDILAEQLQVPAEQVWDILVRQPKIKGYSFIGGMSLVVLILLILYITFNKLYKRQLFYYECKYTEDKTKKEKIYGNRHDENLEDGYCILKWITFGIVVIVTLIWIGGTIERIAWIYNSEYYALKDILDIL